MINKSFDPRKDAKYPDSGPGPGDDVPCIKCGTVALDTGLECANCGYDNWEAVVGRPYASRSEPVK